MTNEMIGKAKECKSAEELLALAKENNVEMTEKQAAELFASINQEGELSDDELNSAAGGGCGGSKGDKYLPDIGDLVTFADGFACDCSCKVFKFENCALGWHEITCTNCGKLHLRNWNIKPNKVN